VGPESREEGEIMRTWLNAAVRFVQAEDGPTAVEYAVMLALIVVVCLGAITTLGQNANGTFNNVGLNGTLQGSSSS
jgi:pilus assembly protein Flp/PilA